MLNLPFSTQMAFTPMSPSSSLLLSPGMSFSPSLMPLATSMFSIPEFDLYVNNMPMQPMMGFPSVTPFAPAMPMPQMDLKTMALMQLIAFVATAPRQGVPQQAPRYFQPPGTGFRPAPGNPQIRPATNRPVVPFQGPEKSTIDNERNFQLSGQAMAEIMQNPTQIKQIVQRELEAAAGSKDTSVILQKLTGTKVETGVNHIFKQRLSWDYYNHTVLPAFVEQYAKALNLPPIPQQGRAQSEFTLGGVYFSDAVYQRIQQNPGQIKQILREEMARLAGSNSAKAIVQKYVNDPRDHGANFETWLNEDLDKMAAALRKELLL